MKTVKAACSIDTVIVLGEKGRVFECLLKATRKSFSEIQELSANENQQNRRNKRIFFAISSECKVFGHDNNHNCKLGMPSGKYQIVEASTGAYDSLFRTSEEKILGCWWNCYGESMVKSWEKEVYPPEK